jgi:hypothetical protein
LKFENSSYHLSFSTLDDPFWVVSKTVLARKYSFVQHVCNYYAQPAAALRGVARSGCGANRALLEKLGPANGAETQRLKS